MPQGIIINDDRGKPLNLPINQQTPSGIYRTFLNSNNPKNVMKSDSAGFTSPFDYITDNGLSNTSPGLTGIPLQFGNNPTNLSPNWNNNNIVYNDGVVFDQSSDIYDTFNNNKQYNFVHNLDSTIQDGSGQFRGNINQDALANSTGDSNPLQSIYLGSFIQTSDDNEDPTMFGYDITINIDSSPLFNGSIITFINQFGGQSGDVEIESRRNIWITFCNQFFKFFSIDQPSTFLPYNPSKYNSSTSEAPGSTGSTILPPVSVEFPSPPQKAYYLKKLSGLEKLVEGDISSNSEAIKSMVDYGKDIITLSLYEDVSVNTGYLSMLYKTLVWSRLNGKQMIPENLLRFDATITVTEIRDYNRVIKNANSGNTLTVYADFLSRYTYNLYDCQFKFDKLSHGNEIDMWNAKSIEDFDIAFNYKYSTLRFDKFAFQGTQSQQYSIFNGQSNVLSVNSKNSNSSAISNNSLNTSISAQDLIPYTQIPSSPVTLNSFIDNLAAQSAQSKIDSYGQVWQNHVNNLSNPSPLDILEGKIINAGINAVNTQITTQARLLNNTLDNIRNSIGLGRMSAPTNVYYGNSPFKNDVTNAARDFVGTSVKGFFTP